MNCLFCKIIKKEIPSNIIYEDEKFLVFLDLDQTTMGHTLIIPKKHYEDYMELEDEMALEMFQLAKKISSILMKKLNKKGMTLLINYGDSQEVKHVHLHLLPNYQKEENTMSNDEIYHMIKDEL